MFPTLLLLGIVFVLSAHGKCVLVSLLHFSMYYFIEFENKGTLVLLLIFHKILLCIIQLPTNSASFKHFCVIRIN